MVPEKWGQGYECCQAGEQSKPFFWKPVDRSGSVKGRRVIIGPDTKGMEGQ